MRQRPPRRSLLTCCPRGCCTSSSGYFFAALLHFYTFTVRRWTTCVYATADPVNKPALTDEDDSSPALKDEGRDIFVGDPRATAGGDPQDEQTLEAENFGLENNFIAEENNANAFLQKTEEALEEHDSAVAYDQEGNAVADEEENKIPSDARKPRQLIGEKAPTPSLRGASRKNYAAIADDAGASATRPQQTPASTETGLPRSSRAAVATTDSKEQWSSVLEKEETAGGESRTGGKVHPDASHGYGGPTPMTSSGSEAKRYDGDAAAIASTSRENLYAPETTTEKDSTSQEDASSSSPDIEFHKAEFHPRPIKFGPQDTAHLQVMQHEEHATASHARAATELLAQREVMLEAQEKSAAAAVQELLQKAEARNSFSALEGTVTPSGGAKDADGDHEDPGYSTLFSGRGTSIGSVFSDLASSFFSMGTTTGTKEADDLRVREQQHNTKNVQHNEQDPASANSEAATNYTLAAIAPATPTTSPFSAPSSMLQEEETEDEATGADMWTDLVLGTGMEHLQKILLSALNSGDSSDTRHDVAGMIGTSQGNLALDNTTVVASSFLQEGEAVKHEELHREMKTRQTRRLNTAESRVDNHQQQQLQFRRETTKEGQEEQEEQSRERSKFTLNQEVLQTEMKHLQLQGEYMEQKLDLQERAVQLLTWTAFVLGKSFRTATKTLYKAYRNNDTDMLAATTALMRPLSGIGDFRTGGVQSLYSREYMPFMSGDYLGKHVQLVLVPAFLPGNKQKIQIETELSGVQKEVAKEPKKNLDSALGEDEEDGGKASSASSSSFFEQRDETERSDDQATSDTTTKEAAPKAPRSRYSLRGSASTSKAAGVVLKEKNNAPGSGSGTRSERHTAEVEDYTSKKDNIFDEDAGGGKNEDYNRGRASPLPSSWLETTKQQVAEGREQELQQENTMKEQVEESTSTERILTSTKQKRNKRRQSRTRKGKRWIADAIKGKLGIGKTASATAEEEDQQEKEESAFDRFSAAVDRDQKRRVDTSQPRWPSLSDWPLLHGKFGKVVNVYSVEMVDPEAKPKSSREQASDPPLRTMIAEVMLVADQEDPKRWPKGSSVLLPAGTLFVLPEEGQYITFRHAVQLMDEKNKPKHTCHPGGIFQVVEKPVYNTRPNPKHPKKIRLRPVGVKDDLFGDMQKSSNMAHQKKHFIDDKETLTLHLQEHLPPLPKNSTQAAILKMDGGVKGRVLGTALQVLPDEPLVTVENPREGGAEKLMVFKLQNKSPPAKQASYKLQPSPEVLHLLFTASMGIRKLSEHLLNRELKMLQIGSAQYKAEQYEKIKKKIAPLIESGFAAILNQKLAIDQDFRHFGKGADPNKANAAPPLALADGKNKFHIVPFGLQPNFALVPQHTKAGKALERPKSVRKFFSLVLNPVKLMEYATGTTNFGIFEVVSAQTFDLLRAVGKMADDAWWQREIAKLDKLEGKTKGKKASSFLQEEEVSPIEHVANVVERDPATRPRPEKFSQERGPAAVNLSPPSSTVIEVGEISTQGDMTLIKPIQPRITTTLLEALEGGGRDSLQVVDMRSATSGGHLPSFPHSRSTTSINHGITSDDLNMGRGSSFLETGTISATSSNVSGILLPDDVNYASESGGGNAAGDRDRQHEPHTELETETSTVQLHIAGLEVASSMNSNYAKNPRPDGATSKNGKDSTFDEDDMSRATPSSTFLGLGESVVENESSAPAAAASSVAKKDSAGGAAAARSTNSAPTPAATAAASAQKDKFLEDVASELLFIARTAFFAVQNVLAREAKADPNGRPTLDKVLSVAPMQEPTFFTKHEAARRGKAKENKDGTLKKSAIGTTAFTDIEGTDYGSCAAPRFEDLDGGSPTPADWDEGDWDEEGGEDDYYDESEYVNKKVKESESMGSFMLDEEDTSSSGENSATSAEENSSNEEESAFSSFLSLFTSTTEEKPKPTSKKIEKKKKKERKKAQPRLTMYQWYEERGGGEDGWLWNPKEKKWEKWEWVESVDEWDEEEGYMVLLEDQPKTGKKGLKRDWDEARQAGDGYIQSLFHPKGGGAKQLVWKWWKPEQPNVVEPMKPPWQIWLSIGLGIFTITFLIITLTEGAVLCPCFVVCCAASCESCAIPGCCAASTGGGACCAACCAEGTTCATVGIACTGVKLGCTILNICASFILPYFCRIKPWPGTGVLIGAGIRAAAETANTPISGKASLVVAGIEKVR
ncbi:unnamed protein product [Amoebophrya sp. A120]|nr:unnamed protein product [Amoebophrya sp. A120]|eukprot:GSA120T00018757001.1